MELALKPQFQHQSWIYNRTSNIAINQKLHLKPTHFSIKVLSNESHRKTWISHFWLQIHNFHGNNTQLWMWWHYCVSPLKTDFENIQHTPMLLSTLNSTSVAKQKTSPKIHFCEQNPDSSYWNVYILNRIWIVFKQIFVNTSLLRLTASHCWYKMLLCDKRVRTFY